MNACVLLRSLTMAAFLSGVLAAVACPAAAQAESPQAAAGAWASKMIQTLRTHNGGTRPAISWRCSRSIPTSSRCSTPASGGGSTSGCCAPSATRRWTGTALVDLERLRDISRLLEERGAVDWENRYRKVLESAKARINIICTGASRAKVIELSCSASDLERQGVSLGRAPVSFSLGWLNEPIALELAVREFAGAVGAADAGRRTVGTVKIADANSKVGTRLSRHIAGSLEDAVHERMGSYAGRGRWGPRKRRTPYQGRCGCWREEGGATGGGPGRGQACRLGPGICPGAGTFCRRGRGGSKVADPSEVFLPDGYTLADWALLRRSV